MQFQELKKVPKCGFYAGLKMGNQLVTHTSCYLISVFRIYSSQTQKLFCLQLLPLVLKAAHDNVDLSSHGPTEVGTLVLRTPIAFGYGRTADATSFYAIE